MSNSCNPLDCSLPGSSVHGMSQARILECIAISFSRGSSQPRDQTCVSCIGRWILFTTEPLGSPITMAQKSKDPGCHHTHGFLSQKHWHRHTVQFSSVELLSCVRLFATPWTAVRQASLSITCSWSLLKLMSIESVMPSSRLILCQPLLRPPSIFPSIRVFSKESVLCITWPKYWSFSFSISPLHDHVQNRQPVGSCWITQGAQPSAPRWPSRRGEREAAEGGDKCTLSADSLCWAADPTTL